MEALHESIEPETLTEVSFPPPLADEAARALVRLGGEPLYPFRELTRSAASLRRPAASPDMLIQQAMRLGLLELALSSKADCFGHGSAALACRAGYGVIAPGKANIGITGFPSKELIKSLVKAATGPLPFPVQVLSLGDWIPLNDGYVECACTSGEAELLLSSGSIKVVVGGSKTDPAIAELCRTLGIPIMLQPSSDPEKIIEITLKTFELSPRSSFAPGTSSVGKGTVIMTEGRFQQTLVTGAPRKGLALIGGGDMLQESLGSTPVEVARALCEKGYTVATWGDAALWMIKSGLATQQASSPIQILDPRQGPLLGVKALAGADKLQDLRGICVTGLKECRELTNALGLATLGLNVCVAAPLPLWGSSHVRALLTEKVGAGNGSLTHFDHPPRDHEILEWFVK
jgi:hypothetical protein